MNPSPILRPTLSMAPAAVNVQVRADHSLILKSMQALRHQPVRALGDWLTQWASAKPDHVFLAERTQPKAGEANSVLWRKLTYSQVLTQVRNTAQGLLNLGVSAQRPVMVLSDNSIDHALLALATMHIGAAIVPVSPAYSLLSKDFAKLRYIYELVKPAAVYAADTTKFADALNAVGAQSLNIQTLSSTQVSAQVEQAFAAITPKTSAKILFTSGSTGNPKGVINTHRMLTINQEQAATIWPFMDEISPVLVDWLPWNHTFGGNYNFNQVLRGGGTLYIDGGKPMPGLIETTVSNLKQIAPTMYFNVPRGFDLLIPFLETDAELRRNFFSKCRFVFYAGAALPQHLWERMETLAHQELGGDLALVSAWGSTETAPLATAVHFPVPRSGIIGLPVPECTLKLVPLGAPNLSNPLAGKFEVRVQGDNIMTGYINQAQLSNSAFDEEQFYKIGDAVRFFDTAAPEKGLVFDGRVAEDFKLTSGTWVHVGGVRLALLAAGHSLIQDAVITGHDRDDIGALVFLNPNATAQWPADQIKSKVAHTLQVMARAHSSNSTRVVRAMIMLTPPQIDGGEITDKGYINQRAVLKNRHANVEQLYLGGSEVILLESKD
jgi:feruloyl-CoA synthase